MDIPYISAEELKKVIEQRRKELAALEALLVAGPVLIAAFAEMTSKVKGLRKPVPPAEGDGEERVGSKQLEVLLALAGESSMTVRKTIPLIGADTIDGEGEVEKAKVISKRMQALMRKGLVEPDPEYSSNKYDYRWRLTAKGKKVVEGV